MRGVLVALLAAGACAHAPNAPRAEGDAWRFDVGYADGQLDVRARYAAGSLGDSSLRVDPGSGAFVGALTATGEDGAPLAVAAEGDAWRIEGCEARGCEVRYTFDLRASGRGGRRGRGDMAAMFDARAGELLFASPPSRWLLRGPEPPRGTRFRLSVHATAPERFVTGLTPAEDGAPGVSAGWAGYLASAPYSAFGRLRVHTYNPPGGQVDVAIPMGAEFDDEAALLRWAERAIDGVASYLGAFPVRHAAIIVVPTGDDGVYFGAARGNGGAAVQVLVGPATTDATLRGDWVLVHELAHLGLPNLPRAQHWWEEGLATYLEIVIRAQLGLRSEEEAWTELAGKLPQGLLAPGDGGFNRSQTWAHTYWGGALFCFLADVRIREATHGAHDLADALRAVQEAGGTIVTGWAPEEIIRIADAATGVPVLAELWRDLAEGERPEVDLAGLLRRLGVALDSTGRAQLDDHAPSAALRRALLAPRAR